MLLKFSFIFLLFTFVKIKKNLHTQHRSHHATKHAAGASSHGTIGASNTLAGNISAGSTLSNRKKANKICKKTEEILIEYSYYFDDIHCIVYYIL